MQLDEALDEGEAEPRPRLPRLRIAALEFLEDARLVLARDADAIVGDDERHLLGLAAGGEADGAAGRREFDGVRDEVEERLLEAPLIRGDGAEIGGTIEFEVEVLLARPLARQRQHAGHEAG